MFKMLGYVYPEYPWKNDSTEKIGVISTYHLKFDKLPYEKRLLPLDELMKQAIKVTKLDNIFIDGDDLEIFG